MSGRARKAFILYLYDLTIFVLKFIDLRTKIELGLNPDRADVIIPATRIYLNAMKWSGARQIYVPKIGLSDGIVKAMYYGNI
jgi:exopolyphosphatase/guanosine-5'-triphosphate,3'-diphosphate pyrophosphatase